jgi:hypothetical protein
MPSTSSNIAWWSSLPHDDAASNHSASAAAVSNSNVSGYEQGSDRQHHAAALRGGHHCHMMTQRQTIQHLVNSNSSSSSSSGGGPLSPNRGRQSQRTVRLGDVQDPAVATCMTAAPRVAVGGARCCWSAMTRPCALLLVWLKIVLHDTCQVDASEQMYDKQPRLAASGLT